MIPEMKQEYELTAADFERHPVWIGVHNYDSGAAWYEDADEETYRPWTGALPFTERRGIPLVHAKFVLADGTTYPGYFKSAALSWDDPVGGGHKSPDGTEAMGSWSSRHGGTKLSLLALLDPIVFVKGRAVDFNLRIPERRRQAVHEFYGAFQKTPSEIFPVRFESYPNLTDGITTGSIGGLYFFPIGGAFEIDKGESLLSDFQIPRSKNIDRKSVSMVQTSPKEGSNGSEDGELGTELSPEDFRRHPVWVQIQLKFRPWIGSLPVDSKKENVRIPATFTLQDRSTYEGYVRAVPEDWADVSPVREGRHRTDLSPRARFGGSPHAIVGQQRPCIFSGGKRLLFWCGARGDIEEMRSAFYGAIPKRPQDVFPIRFESPSGLATGILSGQIDGFYEVQWGTKKGPRIVR